MRSGIAGLSSPVRAPNHPRPGPETEVWLAGLESFQIRSWDRYDLEGLKYAEQVTKQTSPEVTYFSPDRTAVQDWIVLS